MSTFIESERIARRLVMLRGRVFCVHKATRVGCTLSLLKESCRSNKKVVLFCPKTRIIREVEKRLPTTMETRPKIASLLSNSQLCRKLKPKLKMKFQLKPVCTGCEYKNPADCNLQRILNEDFNVYLLTNEKLRVLQLSHSPEAKELLNKLWRCEVLVFDEFTTSILRSMPTLSIKTIDDSGEVATLRQSLNRLLREYANIRIIDDDAFVILRNVIEQFLDQFEKTEKSEVVSNRWMAPISEEDAHRSFNKIWRLLTKLTEAGLDTMLLQETMLVAFSREIAVLHQDGNVTATPKLEDALEYIRNFCRWLVTKAVFLVDSYLPILSFDKLFAGKVIHIRWGLNGDPLRTNEKQLIVCDTYHWSSVNFLRDRNLQERVRLFLKKLVELFPPEKMFLVTTNKQMARIIAKWDLPRKFRITWYRGPLSRGVQVGNRRILVSISGPYLPKKAYASESASFRFEDFALKIERLPEDEKRLTINRFLRYVDTKSEFINMIGRVKDELAVEPSIVFCLGMDVLDVRTLLKQHGPYEIAKPHVISPITQGGLMKDFGVLADMWLNSILPSDKDIKDLPLLARIIRITKQRREIRASEVLPGHKNFVIENALKHQGLLSRYNIEIKRKQRGLTFGVALKHITLKDFTKD